MKVTNSLKCFWKYEKIIFLIILCVCIGNIIFLDFTVNFGDNEVGMINAVLIQSIPHSLSYLITASIVNIAVSVLIQINFSVNRKIINKAIIIINIIRSVVIGLIVNISLYYSFELNHIFDIGDTLETINVFGIEFGNPGLFKYLIIFVYLIAFLYLISVLMNFLSICTSQYGAYHCIGILILICAAVVLVWNYLAAFLLFGVHSIAMLIGFILLGLIFTIVNYKMILRFETKR